MKAHPALTIRGPAGTATRMMVTDRGPDQAEVATWLLHCPGQSPGWEKFWLFCIHLRPLDGVPDANINVPGATHEIMLLALDPSFEPGEDLPWHYLRPANVTEQFQVPDDDAAVELTGLCAQAVVNGRLWAEPPLSGQTEPWHTTIIRTSAHARGEPHA